MFDPAVAGQYISEAIIIIGFLVGLWLYFKDRKKKD